MGNVKLIITGLIIGLAGCAGTLPKAEIEVREGRISEDLVGFNLLYWIDDAAHLASGELVEQIDGIRPGLLRYPAGTASQNYDWQNNSVINENIFPKKQDKELLDTKMFVDVIERTGASGVVVVDITSEHLKDRAKAVKKGQPGYTVAQPLPFEQEQVMLEKAIAWAEYFKSRDFSPKFYELGNEHYLGFLDYMVYTPEMYAEKCLIFMDAIRSVDPDAKFGICGPDPFYRSHYYYDNTEWWPVVLEHLAEEADYLILHTYWVRNMISEDNGQMISDFRTKLKNWGAAQGKSVEHLKIGFTEWGGRGLNENEFGIFTFRFFVEMLQHDLDFAVQWPFRWAGTGDFKAVQLVKSNTGEKQFAYYVMQMWSRHFSGKFVEPTLQWSELPAKVYGIAAVDASGSVVAALANGSGKTVTVNVPSWLAQQPSLETQSITESGSMPLAHALDQKNGIITIEPNTVLLMH